KKRHIIDTLEPVLNQHRLVVDQRLIKKDFETAADPKYSLFYLLTRITKDKGALTHDDRLDALAGAVRYWTLQMGKDTEKAAQAHKEKLLEAELKKFMKTVLGQAPEKLAELAETDRWMVV